MKKRAFLMMLFASLLFEACFAAKLISLYGQISNNDTFLVYEFVVTDGMESFPEDSGDYHFKLLDSAGAALLDRDFGVDFVLMSTPPIIQDATSIFFSVPYDENAKKVQITKKDSVIFEEEIPVCNGDGVCDSGENYFNCPADCLSGSSDSYCDGLSDGVCDPDCDKSADPDCGCGDGICAGTETFATCPADCPGGGNDTYCDMEEDDICDEDCVDPLDDPDCKVIDVEDQEKEKRCFIATAVYGSPDAEKIDVLRDFRDEYLLTNSAGTKLTLLYYTLSPPVANLIAGNWFLKFAVRFYFVEPIVLLVRLLFFLF